MSGFKVQRQKCNQCMFSENRIVSIKRMKEVIKECKIKDTHFICHKATIKKIDVCCRGDFERNKHRTNLMRVAARLNMVKEIDVL